MESKISKRSLRDAKRRADHQEAAKSAPEAPRPPANAPVVEFRGVHLAYPGGTVGLDGATFAVERGEFVFLVATRKTNSPRSTAKVAPSSPTVPPG